MNIEDLKKLGVSEDIAEQILDMHKKALSDKESELEMATEKIGELMEENSARTVDMGLKHGAAASGEQFGFKFTGIWCK
ncbi:MAG: hypothetical protein J1F11_03380 [Oscillospiraceae bacterium]|nr:hypothetical protein [Oscillospiraceae bacterium]